MNEKLFDYSTDFQRKEYGGNRHIKKASNFFEDFAPFTDKRCIYEMLREIIFTFRN